ncbi:MAG: hypothetical protein AAB973_00140 [Patescibacteria group bacterium]
MTTLFNLQPGRRVVVRQGFGLVTIADTEDVIAYAGKHYAITASGIVLTEIDRYGVIQRQEIKPAGSFHISAKARRLQEALLLPLEVPYLSLEER